MQEMQTCLMYLAAAAAERCIKNSLFLRDFYDRNQWMWRNIVSRSPVPL
jgi:hypothetical protein